MASELSRDELQRLARLGAQRRLEELRQEEAAIRAAFPDLDDSASDSRGRRSRKGARSAGRAATGSSAAGAMKRKAKRRRRVPMTTAQKRAVSERMKKYWAARRKAEG